MTEDDLWEWLRDVALPLGHYSRIESGDTAPGFPDVDCQVPRSGSFKLELKCARHPNRPTPFTQNQGVRRSQIIWIRDHLRNGGRVWIVAEVSPEIYVIHGRHADRVNGASKGTLRDLSSAVLSRKFPQEAADKLARIFSTE